MSEAFVYCWSDFATNKLYVGSHKGTPEDGYICSSKPMMEEYTKRAQDFSRQILAFGTHSEMFIFEQAILRAANAHKDPGFYNQAICTGPFYTKGPRDEATKAKLSAAANKQFENPVAREISRANQKKQFENPALRERLSVIGKAQWASKSQEEKQAWANNTRIRMKAQWASMTIEEKRKRTEKAVAARLAWCLRQRESI